jgi:hypothetical protein
MRSETGAPISACLSTATIGSTLNRLRFTASSFPLQGGMNYAGNSPSAWYGKGGADQSSATRTSPPLTRLRRSSGSLWCHLQQLGQTLTAYTSELIRNLSW